MDEQTLITKLTELTGSLHPTPDAPEADLRAVRLALAYCLLRGQADATTHMVQPVEEPHGVTPAQIEHALLAELSQIAGEAAREVDAKRAEPLELRVFRRELPILTSQDPASIPSWAAGLAIDQTLGPFRGADGRPFWFDFYRAVRQVPVVRPPGNIPFLILPLQGIIRDAARYTLPRGSLWIASQMLTQTAPSGSYTGLRIAGGTLTLSRPATVAIGVIQVPSDATGTLTIQLDPPTTPGAVLGPGVDASNAVTQLPTEVTFVFSPTGAAITAADDALAVLYGTEVRLRRTMDPPVYEPALNSILVPFASAPARLEIVESRSNLFRPLGAAPITGGAWALPVAVTSPTALGEAAGDGALVVIVAPGLQAQWQGLTNGSVQLNRTFLLVEAGRLVVTALQAENRRTSQVFILWREAMNGSPRSSSIDIRYDEPFVLQYISQQTGVEAILTSGTAVAHLDRPLCSDGTRPGIRATNTRLILFEDTTGTMVFLRAVPDPGRPMALALSNAVFKTTPVEVLILFGMLQASNQVQNGTLSLGFGLYRLLPTLPDPYVSNLSVTGDVVGIPPPGARLAVSVHWPQPETATLSLALAASPGNTVASLLAPASDKVQAERITTRGFDGLFPRPSNGLDPATIMREDAERTAELRVLFDRTVGGIPEQFFLLDISSNADQLGVGLGLREQAPAAVQIIGTELVTAGNNIRIFTAPEVQWEPVRTIQNPDLPFFPTPLASANDGGPTLIGVNTVDLVPIAPRPVLRQIVTEFNRQTAPRPAAALFTLPFGMKAVAFLFPPHIPGAAGALLSLNQPEFTTPGLEGGLQLSMAATSGSAGPDVESPGFPGATVQTRNGVDPATGLPMFLSVLGDNQINFVENTFNNEFAPAPAGGRPRVPVTRIDFSGYGASLFSDWVNPTAAIAETSQVRFDVLVGRTAYEVVQVRSILYPWGVRVIRTVTIQRTGSGGVFRRDSGWVAISPGVYNFRTPTADPGIVTHPGVVRGVLNVRHIRDTSQVFERSGGAVKLAAVYFDADVPIKGVIRGQGPNGLVPTQNQLGFVQLAPRGIALTPPQFADLLQDQGPLGGPVDCVVDVGGSGQHMRVTRVDVSSAQTPGGNPVFVAAARGSLILPRDGQWSLTRQRFDSEEPQALDPSRGLPLIRQGEVSLDEAANANPFRFADPADLLKADSPDADYGLLQSTGTQRLLFPRPKIERGARQITSTVAPRLADALALLTAVGIFPKTSACFAFPTSNYALDILGEGQFKLTLPFTSFPAAAPPVRDLVNAPPVRIYGDYSDGAGAQTEVTVTINASASPSWSVRMAPVSIVTDIAPFSGLMRIIYTVDARSDRASQFTDIRLAFGSAMAPVQAIMTLFQGLGFPTPFTVAMSNPQTTLKADLNIPFTVIDPNSPTGERTDDVPVIPGVLTLFDSGVQVGFFEEFGHTYSIFFKLGGKALVPPLQGAGLFEFQISADAVEGTKISLKVAIGYGVGLDSVPIIGEAKGYALLGVELGFGSEITLKPLLLVGLAFDLFHVFSVKVEIEASGQLKKTPTGGIELVAELEIAVDIEIFLVIDIEFDVDYDYSQGLS